MMDTQSVNRLIRSIFGIVFLLGEGNLYQFGEAFQFFQRKADKERGRRSYENDHKSSRIDEGNGTCSLQNHPHNDCHKAKNNTDNC